MLLINYSNNRNKKNRLHVNSIIWQLKMGFRTGRGLIETAKYATIVST